MQKRKNSSSGDRPSHSRNNMQPKQESKTARREYNDPTVFRVRRDTQCGKCKEEIGKGRMVKLEGEGNERIALCKPCAGLGDLYYVPAGDAKLTRLLTKYSKQKHVVVRWATARKRYERQGVLVELEALNKAEADLGQPLTVDEDLDDIDDTANDAE